MTLSLVARIRAAFLLLLGMMSSPALAQPSGEEILKRVEQHFAGIQDYTVTLDVIADLERLKVPPMHVTMYFKQPDKIHFDSEGFALLPRKGMILGTGELSKRFSVLGSVEEVVEGKKKFKLSLEPRERRAREQFTFYVDQDRWSVDRIIASAPDGRKMTATLEYDRHEGRWLPSLLRISFEVVEAGEGDEEFSEPRGPFSRRSPPQSGTVTIRYSNYRINTGLSDELFESEKGERK